MKNTLIVQGRSSQKLGHRTATLSWGFGRHSTIRETEVCLSRALWYRNIYFDAQQTRLFIVKTVVGSVSPINIFHWQVGQIITAVSGVVVKTEEGDPGKAPIQCMARAMVDRAVRLSFVALINYQKPVGLKQYKCMLLQIWRWTYWATIQCWQACIPPGGSREESVPLLFPASEGHLCSMAYSSFLQL